MRLATILAGTLLLVAPPGLADGPIATASGSGGGAPQPSTATPAPLPSAQGQGADDDAPPLRLGPCGPQTIKADGSPDQSAHGEVDVGVGTGGYRHVALHLCKPIGDNGAIAVSVSDTQGGAGRRAPPVAPGPSGPAR